jgi:mycolipenoyl-CoA---2-(long-chain-fatty acyl)-trehalose mycolipenoyltransferase / long-chain-acyl-CoA---trehalose acyltransferase
MMSADIRVHILATPDPLQWDCSGFERIQRADNFTFCMSVDQLCTDGMSADVIVPEIYAALLEIGAPIPLRDPASCDDYSVGQQQRAAALTPESRQVPTLIECVESNDATSPGEFALVSCEM